MVTITITVNHEKQIIFTVSEKFLYCLITPSLWSVLVLVLVLVWPHQYHSPGQTRTIINGRVPSYYLCLYYDRIFPFHIRRNTVVYREKNDCIRSLYTEFACGVRFSSYFSVFFSYTVTKIYDRNTDTSNTAEYGRIRS